MQPHASNRLAWLVLLLLGAALAIAVLQDGGLEPIGWNVGLILIGVAAALTLLVAASTLPMRRRWAFLLLPGYALLQAIPLPPALVQVLSPARAALFVAAQPFLGGERLVSLAVKPAAAWDHALRLCGYALAFVVARSLASRREAWGWLTAVPVVAIAAFESLWGLQQAGGSGPLAVAHGSYLNRNHLAGLLEIALPFPVFFAIGLRRSWRTVAALGIAALILLAALRTLSRMGLVSIVVSLAVSGAVAMYGRFRRSLVAGILLVVVASAWLIPQALVRRFESLQAGDVSMELRWRLWNESLPLVRDFPVFGCGLGGYGSVIDRYKDGSLDIADYAHNDYLQYLIEVGPVVWGAVLFCAGLFLYRLLRGARDAVGESRYVALAAAAALLAMLTHSLADYNLYIPANAFAFAWVAGIGAGTLSTSRSTGRWPVPLAGAALAACAMLALWHMQPAPEPSSPVEAVAQARRALARDSASPFAWCDLGDALLATRQDDEARLCFRRAILLGPRLPEVLKCAASGATQR